MNTEKTMVDVTDKALDKALDKAEQLVVTAADKAGDIFEATYNLLHKGIEQYGPQAIDAVLWVVRIDAMQSLLYGYVTLFLCSAIIYIVNFSKYNFHKHNSPHDTSGSFIALMISFFICLIIAHRAAPRVLDVWKYTAVVKPELYLVKKTIDLVEQKIAK